MPSKADDPRITSMHEAAHAVLALTYGLNIKAQVIDEFDSNGYMEFDQDITPNTDAVVSLAGFVVEVDYLNVPKARAMRHARSDLEDVDTAAHKAMDTVGGRKLFKEQATSIAKTLIAKHMRVIKKVASQLMTGAKIEITVDQFRKM